MKTNRRKFLAQEKVRMLRQHLVEKVPISEVCDQNGIQPTRFYQWQKQFFENGAAAFAPPEGDRNNSQIKKLKRSNAHLQEKLSQKDAVIAEIMESHIQLKKNLGQD